MVRPKDDVDKKPVTLYLERELMEDIRSDNPSINISQTVNELLREWFITDSKKGDKESVLAELKNEIEEKKGIHDRLKEKMENEVMTRVAHEEAQKAEEETKITRRKMFLAKIRSSIKTECPKIYKKLKENPRIINNNNFFERSIDIIRVKTGMRVGFWDLEEIFVPKTMSDIQEEKEIDKIIDENMEG